MKSLPNGFLASSFPNNHQNKNAIIMSQSVLFENELSTVTLKTAPTPAHRIEFYLKIGVSF